MDLSKLKFYGELDIPQEVEDAKRGITRGVPDDEPMVALLNATFELAYALGRAEPKESDEDEQP